MRHRARSFSGLLIVAVCFWWGWELSGEDVAVGKPDQAYQKKLKELRAQVGGEFRLAIEKPFVVVSDQSPESFQRSLQHTIRWSVRMLRKDFFSRDPEEILAIYLFDGKESYLRHAKKFFNDDPDTPYGYYSSRQQALVMNIATGGGTLVHEIVHPFMDANFARCPAWFNEGMGSLYEACREQDGHIVGVLNWRLPVLHEGIREGHLVPLRKLLSTSTDEFYNDPHSMHYAQARYLLYYVQENGKLREFYKQFVDNAEKDPAGLQTICRVMKVDSIEALEKNWLKFVGSLRLK